MYIDHNNKWDAAAVKKSSQDMTRIGICIETTIHSIQAQTPHKICIHGGNRAITTASPMIKFANAYQYLHARKMFTLMSSFFMSSSIDILSFTISAFLNL